MTGSLLYDLQQFGVSLDDLKKQAEGELEKRRFAAFLLGNPQAFLRHVTPADKVPFLRKFHDDGLAFVHRGHRKKLVLWPRGHLKTTIFTQIDALRMAISDPNIRILLSSSVWDNAKTFLLAIKGLCMQDSVTSLWGDLLPNSRSDRYFKNNESELTLSIRSNKTLREATFSTTGLDKTRTSQHYDYIIHDDLINETNSTSFDALDNVWKIWQGSLDLLEPGGKMLVIGTRWHPLDLYGRIMLDYCDPRCLERGGRHVRECKCGWDVSVLTLRDLDGKYIFDSKFDDRIVDELLRIKGRANFAAQYLNNPSDASTVWFPQDKLAEAEQDFSFLDRKERGDDKRPMRGDLLWLMSVDPAESEEQRSSFTACVCVGIDMNNGDWYVDYAKQARVNTPKFINLVFEARKLMKPHRFGMEFHTRKALEYNLRQEMISRGDLFQIEELKPMLGNTPEAKEVRIKRLIPLFDFGKMHINHRLTDLLNLLYTIPAATSWDLVDALSYIMDMAPKGAGSGAVNAPLPAKVVSQKGTGYSYVARRRVGTGRPGGPSTLPRIHVPIRSRRASKRAYS